MPVHGQVRRGQGLYGAHGKPPSVSHNHSYVAPRRTHIGATPRNIFVHPKTSKKVVHHYHRPSFFQRLFSPNRPTTVLNSSRCRFLSSPGSIATAVGAAAMLVLGTSMIVAGCLTMPVPFIGIPLIVGGGVLAIIASAALPSRYLVV
ncbi:MAG: hypothetical protein CMO81_05265 [Waddliaceae bacterium]|nr:hypothetical protein [Waddliaceae bacterium]